MKKILFSQKMKEPMILQKKMSEIGVPPMSFLPVLGVSTGVVKFYNVLLD